MVPNFILVIPDCEGQVAIVTGGNKGIGYETVKGLSNAHIMVIMGKHISWIQHDSSSLFLINIYLSDFTETTPLARLPGIWPETSPPTGSLLVASHEKQEGGEGSSTATFL